MSALCGSPGTSYRQQSVYHHGLYLIAIHVFVDVANLCFMTADTYWRKNRRNLGRLITKRLNNRNAPVLQCEMSSAASSLLDLDYESYVQMRSIITIIQAPMNLIGGNLISG